MDNYTSFANLVNDEHMKTYARAVSYRASTLIFFILFDGRAAKKFQKHIRFKVLADYDRFAVPLVGRAVEVIS